MSRFLLDTNAAAQLRDGGRVMQQVDLQIAPIALTLGQCTVVSEDSDLTFVPGLRVENWAVSRLK